MASSMHNIRLLRFLIVLTMVVLTIFIYTSYSTTQTLALPPIAFSLLGNRSIANDLDSSAAKINANRPHNGNTAMDSAHKSFIYNHKLVNPSSNAGSHASGHAFIKKITHHREPTIDVNAIDEDQAGDGRPNTAGDENIDDETALEHFNNNNNDLLQDEQYIQVIDNTLGNTNTSFASVANGGLGSLDINQQLKQQHQQLKPTPDQLQQQQDQQVGADTNNNDNNIINNSNLNKIPESDVLIPTSNLQKFIESADKILKNLTAHQPLSPNPAPTDIVNKASPNVPKVTSTTKKVPKLLTDPIQGIPTQQLYEPGHMDEEVDIDQICPYKGEKLKLLILITSAQTHTEARLAIRQTWGHFGTRRDVSTAFILGRTTNATINAALTQENSVYGDLIRGNFIDSYNNLTLKTISSLEWIERNCPKAKYILKTDDDMFINVPRLLQFLDDHSKEKRIIYGRLAKNWKPVRNKNSKYYISMGQFRASVFPPFTTGPAYVFTNDIVHDLYEHSLQHLYLKLEDVYVTGIVAQELGIKRVHAAEFLNRRIAFNPCNIRKSISVHMIKANEQFDLWKKLLDQTTKCK